LFSEARNIVAPHGAALSHLVAVPSSCNIIELNGPSHVRWHFRKMSEALNLRHTLVIGKESTGLNFSVDPRFLIKSMLV
jgi:capsular polysaccharide biosynthesis protein